MSKLLICSAIKSELDELIHLQSDSILVDIIGIGLVESAIQATKFLSSNEGIDTILFTGTCGAYPNSKLQIGDIVSVEKYLLLGVGELLDVSFLPEKMKQSIEFSLFHSNSLKTVSSASVLEITKDNNLAYKISNKFHVGIEHLELFSLASLALKYNKRLISILGVSNYVSAKSHAEWKKNHKIVSQRTQAFVKNYVKKYF